jgi:hypothetical protein
MPLEPVVTNAADKAQVKDAKRKVQSARDAELQDFAQIMSTRVGRRFMWRMLGITRFQESSFTGNSTTFFNEGQRNIGLMLWADLNEACPERYLEMLQESKEK